MRAADLAIYILREAINSAENYPNIYESGALVGALTAFDEVGEYIGVNYAEDFTDFRRLDLPPQEWVSWIESGYNGGRWAYIDSLIDYLKEL